MDEKNKLIVGGYCFGTLEDAELARQEEKKVEYLEQHMDYRKAENVLNVYQKAIKSRLFCTPIGWSYLKRLQTRLSGYKELEDKILPIPIYTVFSRHQGMEAKTAPARPLRKKKDSLKSRFRLSLIGNLLLALAIGGMFYVAATSEHPNILNYEKRLIDEYASWEQELTQKENELREREKALSGTDTSQY